MGKSAHPPGWYTDCKVRGRLRYWDGGRWSEFVADLPPSAEVRRLGEDLDGFVRFVCDREALPPTVSQQLELERDRYVHTYARGWRVRQWGGAVTGEPAGSAAPSDAAPPIPASLTAQVAAAPDVVPEPDSTAPTPVAVGSPWPVAQVAAAQTTATQVTKPPTVEPRFGPTIVERFRHAVAGDLALHGMAYLGILLLFAGLTGFVVFAWGDVERSWRPVAEAAIPASLFLAGWYLRGRGAGVVGRALVLGGGAVLPVVMVAAFVDGAGVPPDLTHGALVAVASLAVAALAVAFAIISTRTDGSPLSHLAAPTLWLAVGIAALAPSSSELVGKTIAQIGAAQLAAVAVAVAVTAIAAQVAADHPLSRPTVGSAVGGIVVVGALAMLTGADEGWPWVAGFVTATALVVAVEGVSALVPTPLVGVTQAGLLGVATVALTGGLPIGWAAATGTFAFLGLLVWESVRGREAAPAGAAGAGAVITGCVSFVEPWAAVVAFGALTLAGHLLRGRDSQALPPVVPTLVAAAAPIGIAVGLFGALSPAIAVTVTGVAAAVMALGVRLSRLRQDRFVAVWPPCAASVVAVLVICLTAAASPEWLAAAAGCAAIAVASSVVAPPLRLWATSAVLSEAAAFGLTAAGLGIGWQAIVLGSTGLLLVIAGRGEHPLAGHLGLLGHVATLAAVATAAGTRGDIGDSGTLAATLAVATAGFVLTALRQERGGAPPVATTLRVLRLEGIDAERIAQLPVFLALIGVPVAVASVLEAAGMEGHDLEVGAGLSLGAIGLVYAGGTWLVRDRMRLARLAADIGVVTALAGVAVSARTPWASLVTLIAMAGAVAATAEDVRRPATQWLGWAATGAATVRAANLAGVSTDRLHLAVLAWAGAVGVGALAWDRWRCGPRTGQGWVRRATLQPPAILAAAAFPIGLLPAYSEPQAVWAGWSLVGAVVVAACALLTQFAPLSGVAWLLVSVGAAGFAPIDVANTPLIFVAWGAGLLVVARVLRWRFAAGDFAQNWHLPIEMVALGAITTGVVLALSQDQIAWTWSAAGGVLLVGAWWYRTVAFTAVGVILINGAALDAGHGWSALVLAATALATIAAATQSVGRPRFVLQACGAACTAAAWTQLGVSAAWDATTWAATASLVGGTAACALALATRVGHLDASWTLAWGGLGVAGVAVAAPLVFTGDVDRSAGGIALAAGSLLVGASLAALAKPLGVAAFRHAAVLVFVTVGADIVYATEASQTTVVVSATAAGLAALTAALLLTKRATGESWIAPLELATFVLLVTATAVAAGQWPDRPPLVIAFAASGAACATAGAVTNRPHLTEWAPPLLCMSWLAFASATLPGSPSWLSAPVGVALLVDVGLARADRHQHGAAGTTPAVVAVEATGIGFLIVPPLVQLLIGDLLYALVAVAFGVAVAIWGVLSRVRRRLVSGALTVVITVVLVLGLPLAHAALAKNTGPASSGGLWLAIAGLGLLALLVAVFLEEGRQRLAHAAHRISDFTSGWE